jgi:ADP-ribose pyrophosphatase YjhB (NUDIX family)
VSYVTSVRSIVLREQAVLVVQDRERQHILPGGRIESGEAFTQASERELLEETGWTVNQIRYLGFKHFHHLTPKPEGYAYPYPDFLQVN